MVPILKYVWASMGPDELDIICTGLIYINFAGFAFCWGLRLG